MPGNPESGSRSPSRWQIAPGGRDLGRVWITVVFAALTVFGVLGVTILGIRNGREGVDHAERVEVAVEAVALMRGAILALQDERGRAELWLTDRSVASEDAYAGAQEASDDAVEALRRMWQRRRGELDAVGPPSLTDVEEGMATLANLRVATMDVREDSTVEAYSSVIDVVLAAVRRVEGVTAESEVSSGARSLVRIVEAGEALARQRDIVTSLLRRESEVSQEELVRLLLLQQEARTNLSAIRALGVQGTGIRVSEFLAGMAGGEAQMMLESLESQAADVDPHRWYSAASDRLETLRLVGSAVEGDLQFVSEDLQGTAERTVALRTIGLSGLLVVSILAGAAAIGVARERAKALGEHGELARGLFEWFEPDRLTPVEGLHVAGRYDAASEFTRAGGDWYDVYRIPDGRVALTVGDVAGHGATATAQMAQARNLLRGMTLAAPDRSPARLLSDLDGALRNTGLMATIFHGILDLEDRTLVYVRAGHPPGVLLHEGSADRLEGRLGPPVGIESDQDFADSSVRLPDTWRLLLFSDGLFETRDIDLDAALDAVVRRAEGFVGDPEELADTLIEARPSRLDDAALLVVGNVTEEQPGGTAED